MDYQPFGAMEQYQYYEILNIITHNCQDYLPLYLSSLIYQYINYCSFFLSY